jgi:hypothetical protein
MTSMRCHLCGKDASGQAELHGRMVWFCEACLHFVETASPKVWELIHASRAYSWLYEAEVPLSHRLSESNQDQLRDFRDWLEAKRAETG